MDNPRRRRLIAYFDGPPLRGDRAKLIKKTGYTKGRVAQFFDTTQAFGEAAARNLAERLGLAPDFFEHDRAGSSSELQVRDSSPHQVDVDDGRHSRRTEDHLPGGTVSLSLLDVGASMGPGIVQPQHEEVIRNMHVNETWLRRHAATFSNTGNLALVTGFGDSMEPTFKDGDSLLIDRGVSDIKIDAVYVMALHDELFIKRLQRRPGGEIVMISDNKSYEPYTIKNGEREQFRVLGRVVMAWNSRRI